MPQSSWQSLLVIEQVSVVNRPERFLEMRSAFFPNLEQVLCESLSGLQAYSLKPLTNRFGDRLGHVLASQSCQLFDESTSLSVLDVEHNDAAFHLSLYK
jgi:hypothetical protein